MDSVPANIIIDAAIAVVVVAVIVLLFVAWPRRKEQQVLSLTEVQQGLHRTGVGAVEGREADSGLSLYIRNRGGGPVLVQCPPGTVIEAGSPQRQDMIVGWAQSLEIPQRSTQRLDLDLFSLAAHKLPPGRHGEGGYYVRGLTEDDQILDLLDAVAGLEAEAARHVKQVNGDKVTHRSMVDDLTILTTYCSCEALEVGGYRVRVPDSVIQYALWQITDGLSFDALVDVVVQPPSPEGRVGLVGQVLAANILLEEAGVEPTAKL